MCPTIFDKKQLVTVEFLLNKEKKYKSATQVKLHSSNSVRPKKLNSLFCPLNNIIYTTGSNL